MFSILASAWNVVVRRAVADRLILAAASITILLATVLVASGPIYSDAVTLSGVRRAIADAAVAEANLDIATQVDATTFAETDELVVGEVAAALEAVGFEGVRYATSGTYALAFEPDEGVAASTVFRFVEFLDEHVALIDGSWPNDQNRPLQATISESASARMGLGVGDRLTVTNRRDDTPVEVEVTGIFSVTDPGEAFWFEDLLDTGGFSAGVSASTYGPFFIGFEPFFAVAALDGGRFEWRIFPDHPSLEIADIAPVAGRLSALDDRLNAGRDAGNQMRVETGLVEILRTTERSLLVTRSTMLVVTIQFSLLAGYALVLTAGLIADRRRGEVMLLRSRGADPSQVLTMALMEGALLVLPAVLLAPILASVLLGAFNWIGPLADIDLDIVPTPNPEAYLLALVVGIGCALALGIPAYRAARAFGKGSVNQGRETSSSVVQRARVDVALVALAVVGIWQLRRYGGTISESLGGRLGIDPLLVIAPAIGLVAGGLVALRLLPLMSQISELVMVRSRRLVAALGSWQVARRPQRYGRIVLFLTLSIAIGFFSLAYADTWDLSQSDRAAFAVGADIRDDGSRRVGSDMPHYALEDAYASLPGVEVAMPVGRETGRVARSTTPVRYVLVDATEAADVVAFRDDLSTASFADMMDVLVAARRSLPAYPLAGTPARLAMEVTAVVDSLPPEFENPRGVLPWRLEPSFRMRVILADADANLFRIDLGNVLPGASRLVAPIGYVAADGIRYDPVYPVSLVAIELRSSMPERVIRTGSINILGIQVSEDAAGGTWRSAGIGLTRDDWFLNTTIPRVSIDPPDARMLPDDGKGLVIDVDTGSTGVPGVVSVFFGLRVPGSIGNAPIPVIASDALLAEAGLEVGDEMPLDVSGVEATAVIIGSVREFPTVEPRQGEPVVLDYQTFLASRFEPGGSLSAPSEYWLRVDPARLEETGDALLAEPFARANPLVQAESETSLKSDALARGTIGSLMLGFVAAALLAAIAFAVNTAVSARQRTREFALLRSAGLSNRQLVSWLTLENAVVAGASLVAGTALGWLLVWLVLPLTTLTQSAAVAVPGVIVVYPWRTILFFDAAIVAALVVATGILSSVLRRAGLEAILRAGES